MSLKSIEPLSVLSTYQQNNRDTWSACNRVPWIVRDRGTCVDTRVHVRARAREWGSVQIRIEIGIRRATARGPDIGSGGSDEQHRCMG